MFGSYFWRATAERAVKAFAQSLVAVLSANSIGLFEVNWLACLSTAAMATVLSVLSSIGSSRIGTPQDPSMVRPETTLPAPAVAAPQTQAA